MDTELLELMEVWKMHARVSRMYLQASLNSIAALDQINSSLDEALKQRGIAWGDISDELTL